MNPTHRRIVISGASGLIGTALSAALTDRGYAVTRLVRRRPTSEDEHLWAPGKRPLDPQVLHEAEAVVNLSGASIANMPWTSSYREELISSRLDTTRTLTEALHALAGSTAAGSSASSTAAAHPTDLPKPLLVSASAVGFYGDRPGETLTEASSAGTTFLAELCAEWEETALAAQPAADVALLRTAPVIHRDGILKPLIPLTKLGVSGPLGKGTQVWPWIALDDEVRAIIHIIEHRLTGPVNLAGPAAASANDIGRELASQLHRPFVVPAPKWALRLGLGADAADSLLLPDAHVVPQKLTETGFEFAYPTVSAAIAHALGDGDVERKAA